MKKLCGWSTKYVSIELQPRQLEDSTSRCGMWVENSENGFTDTLAFGKGRAVEPSGVM